MKKFRGLFFLSLSLILTSGCGVSKDINNRTGVRPLPEFSRPQKPVDDKDTLTLKPEELQLTHVTQSWKLNSLTQPVSGENYLKLQKRFASPIQFNGWITLDHVDTRTSGCLEGNIVEPFFTLEDDHAGSVQLQAGQKWPVSLEKLYTLKVEFLNDSLCKGVDVQFGVLYGTND